MDESRRLIVLRHAKSTWPDGVPDRDRPLAARGLRDAPAAGRRLREAGLLPDAVLCSPARRTRQTWELVAQELGAAPETGYDEQLYDASGADLLRVLREVPERVRTLLMVGHLPGVQELTLVLAGETVGDARERAAAKFPTSAMAVLTLGVPWARASEGAGVLTEFTVPRGPKT
ncbi:histidine phosphatase family protein [Kitasatospora aureofaciens]|uniref:SixA phosphatase family protein n=1 Tax=Kitasatospora aureofaciens TaxID=1894 RepID=UPI001C4603B9|nr:histidine phosphatase family protein [Kitasatospora aureofaciens]MBV6696868.1 histidine phosphatase family protein [Kitasatospora aureofaciens]